MFLQASFNGLSTSTFYKALRKKDILVNGVRVKENITVNSGDNITVYIADNYLFKQINFPIVYEDDNIIVVNKPSGIEVVSKNSNEESLTTLLQAQKGYTVMPCHRLDRNTSGLVIFAKNKEVLNILIDKFKTHEIEKYYKCTVYGIHIKPQATLEAYLFKDNKKSLVYIYDEPRKGTVKIITSYKIVFNFKTDAGILDNLTCWTRHSPRRKNNPKGLFLSSSKDGSCPSFSSTTPFRVQLFYTKK